MRPYRRPPSRKLAAVVFGGLVVLGVTGSATVGGGRTPRAGAIEAGDPSSTTTGSVTTTAAVSTSTATPTTSAAATSTAAPPTTSAAATSTSSGGTLVPPPPPSNAPFPAALVAPVPPTPGGGPELDIADLYEAVSEDLSSPDLVVRFRAPFALPTYPYKVSVYVGDPVGERLRASMVSGGGGSKPKGTIETGDGTTWKDAGTTTVDFQNAGFVSIRVPLSTAPAGDAVWAQITVNNSTAPVRVTPFFSRTALFAAALPKGSLPSSNWGRAANADSTVSPDPVALPPGAVLTVGHQLASVTTTDAAPAELLGQPVTEAVDLLRIAPNFDDGAVNSDYVAINRTNGTISLFNGLVFPPVDSSGDRAWVLSGLPLDQPGAPGTVTLDLSAISAALGITLTSDGTGYGVARRLTLADGRVVTAEAVLGTARWFDLGPAPSLPTTTVPVGQTAAPTAATATDDVAWYVAGGALVFVVLGIVAVVVARRRRSAGSGAVDGNYGGDTAHDDTDRVPWGRDDGSVTARATAEIELTKVTGSVPRVEGQDGGGLAEPPVHRPVGVVITGETAAAAAAAREPTTPVGGTPSVAPERGDAPAGEAPPLDEGQPGAPPPATQSSDPLAALAALDTEMTAMRERLGHLGTTPPPPPPDAPSATDPANPPDSHASPDGD